MATPLLVLGLGPAACSAAIAARECGAEVILVGREPPTGPRIGETLPPHAGPILHRLGLDLSANGQLAAPGTAVRWGEGVVENDYLFNPYGPGWHLDRATFDSLLLRVAEECGARIVRGSKLLSANCSDGRWVVSVDGWNGRAEYISDFILDATGRSGWFAHRIGVKRQMIDRLVGIAGFFNEVPPGDVRTFLESAEDGWWYAARLPGGRSVATFMTDADLVSNYPGGGESLWRDRFPASVFAVGVAGTCLSGLRVVAASTTRLNQVTGSGWAAVGDAAMSWDPLSSKGITTALESGLTAGVAAAAALNDGPQAMVEYASRIEVVWEDYLINRLRHYGKVQRWPQSTFWQRRHRTENVSD